jgi:hypothetical protein
MHFLKIINHITKFQNFKIFSLTIDDKFFIKFTVLIFYISYEYEIK